MKQQNLYCRVCGYEYHEPPWGDNNNTPIFEICPCCGVEFGYEDALPESIKKYRKNWIDAGAKWSMPKFEPENWNLHKQLQNIGVEAYS